jgi:hypothetical protein
LVAVESAQFKLTPLQEQQVPSGHIFIFVHQVQEQKTKLEGAKEYALFLQFE